jgi:hypothetical protein
LLKKAIIIIYQIVFLRREVETLRNANEGLSKYQRAKKTRVCLRGTLTVQDTEDILDQRDIDKQVAQETYQNNCSARGTRTNI